MNTASISTSLPAPLAKLGRWLWDPRWFFASLLALFSVIGRLYLGFWTDWSQALVAVGLPVTLELLLGRVVRKEWVHPASALMSGISLSILLTAPPDTHWPYAVAAVLAIGSKYLFRYRDRHIFNPSNFAMAVIVLFMPQYGIANPSQWTNHLGPSLAILALGLVVAVRAKRLDVVISFVSSFFLFGVLRWWLLAWPLWWSVGIALGPEFQLFSFFMVTDPKTTPQTRRGRVIYGVMVGMLDAVMRAMRITYSPFYALILCCLFVPFLDYHISWTKVQPRVKPKEEIV